MFVGGSKVDFGSQDPQIAVSQGFHDLISRTYPNLRMLRVNYTEADISQCLKHSQDGLFGNDVTQLEEAEQEMLALINRNNQSGLRTTIKALIEKFERKPYGWYYAGILCTLANLCARGKIEVRADGNILEDSELEKNLCNASAHSNIVLEPQIEFSQPLVRNLKQFYEEFFEEPPTAGESKAVAKETALALQKQVEQLTNMMGQRDQYPFLDALTTALQTLKESTGKPYAWYLTDFATHTDDLLDLKERVIRPISDFMNGTQKEIYDSARQFKQAHEPNFAYIEGDEASEIIQVLVEPQCFKGNYMQNVKVLLRSLEQKIATQLELEITKAKDSAAQLKERLISLNEFAKLTSDQQQKIITSFDEMDKTLESQTLIAVIRDTLRRFEESDYQRLLGQVTSWAEQDQAHNRATAQEPKISSNTNTTQNQKHQALATTTQLQTRTEIEYVSIKNVTTTFKKAWLAEESDVDSYVDSLKEALLTEINKGKRIQI
jgi:hypothetical protein